MNTAGKILNGLFEAAPSPEAPRPGEAELQAYIEARGLADQSPDEIMEEVEGAYQNESLAQTLVDLQDDVEDSSRSR